MNNKPLTFEQDQDLELGFYWIRLVGEYDNDVVFAENTDGGWVVFGDHTLYVGSEIILNSLRIEPPKSNK